ncbi:MAG TPA: type I 3-dehydroquinate dehydratase [Methylomirabilota bacterium]|nr:type I 3-dehydroquinate dehydratase [Methylomirabilota bacterium]
MIANTPRRPGGNRKSLAQLLSARIPLVAGVVSGPQMLHGLAAQYRPGLCDVVEIRADLIGLNHDWRRAGEEIERAGPPAFVTVRWQAEGGKYPKDDRARVDLLRQALDTLSGVDIELQSAHAREVAEYAIERSKVAIVSFHDFKRTPPAAELNKIVESAGAFANVVKISCMAETEADVETLASLLQRNWGKPLCVIAMGPHGTQSRIDFPTMGSAITYGYLDGSAAPGQLPASQLVSAIRAKSPVYDAFQRDKA